jgi:hypothetical protein
MLIAAFFLCALLGVSEAVLGSGQGVRVVDAVNVSVTGEEVSHALAGEEMTVGESAGRRWRSSTRSFGYSLRIFEDTPLTIVCAFADPADPSEAFDLLVDERKVATRVREPGSVDARDFRVTLPLAETAGKSQVTVTFRAHAGAGTARLLELRTVQEHLE